MLASEGYIFQVAISNRSRIVSVHTVRPVHWDPAKDEFAFQDICGRLPPGDFYVVETSCPKARGGAAITATLIAYKVSQETLLLRTAFAKMAGISHEARHATECFMTAGSHRRWKPGPGQLAESQWELPKNSAGKWLHNRESVCDLSVVSDQVVTRRHLVRRPSDIDGVEWLSEEARNRLRTETAVVAAPAGTGDGVRRLLQASEEISAAESEAPGDSSPPLHPPTPPPCTR